VGPNGPNLSRDDGGIRVIDADGTNKKRLTGSPADDFGPAFSPDGRKVAFTRGYSGDRGTDIYVKKLKGGSARRVTNGGYHHEYEPVFSSDGGRIAFTGARFSSCCADVIVGGGEIATVRPDGTDLKVLTRTPDPPRRRARTSRPTGASWCSTSSGPRTTEECKKNGWKNFKNPNGSPMFKNQGDCVSYVATHGKNEPGQNVPNKKYVSLTKEAEPGVGFTPALSLFPYSRTSYE
jgi:WD40-like Beta Propeller Repeat